MSHSFAIGFSPRIRKSPFFEATKASGAKAFSVYNHMYMPLYYQSLELDYWNLIKHASLWDVGVERQVQVKGKDAFLFTQYLTARDLSALKVGQCKYVLITDENGGIINDPIILRVDEDLFWISLADSDVLLWAKALAHHLKMDVEISEPDVSPLQLQGPKSAMIMRALLGEEIDQMKYFTCRWFTFEGMRLLISRTGWSSELGFEIFLCDHQKGEQLWNSIMRTGQSFNIAPGAPSTIRRIEGAMISHQADTSLDENPFELGLSRLVNLNKDHHFIGREALEKIAQNPIDRCFAGLILEGQPIKANEHHWMMLDQKNQIFDRRFKITSAVYSPRLKQNLALALIPAQQSQIGTKLRFFDGTNIVSGVVSPIPFYDPKKSLAAT
ncbi:MAG: glycine cleavage T C-terminal barrel domain-containing protein [Pseudomonadota bacterium]